MYGEERLSEGTCRILYMFTVLLYIIKELILYSSYYFGFVYRFTPGSGSGVGVGSAGDSWGFNGGFGEVFFFFFFSFFFLVI